MAFSSSGEQQSCEDVKIEIWRREFSPLAWAGSFQAQGRVKMKRRISAAFLCDPMGPHEQPQQNLGGGVSDYS